MDASKSEISSTLCEVTKYCDSITHSTSSIITIIGGTMQHATYARGSHPER